MAVTLPIQYSTQIESAKSAEETLYYLSDLSRSIPENFKGIESFAPESESDSVYRWEFEKLKHGAYEFQIVLRTEKKTAPGKLELISVPGKETSRIHTTWEVTPQGAGANVKFNAKLEVDVPIPGFLKAVIAPMAEKELSKFFDRYRDNVEKVLAA